MDRETILEIVNRLYKAYSNFNEKESKIYTVKGNNYCFQIFINSDPKIVLSSVSEGDFNTIEKIVKAIPFIYLCQKCGIQLLTSINIKNLVD
jgi:hypothetical protein